MHILSHFSALKGIAEEKPHEYAQCGESIHLLHFLLMPKEKDTVQRKLMNANNVVKPSFISVYFNAIKEATTERIFVTNVGKPLVTTLNLSHLW